MGGYWGGVMPPANDLPIGTVVVLGPVSNDRMAVKTKAGWVDLETVEPIAPEAFHVGWKVDDSVQREIRRLSRPPMRYRHG